MVNSGQHLQRVFEKIHKTRMQGLPMVNPALQVAVTHFKTCEHGDLGILVTPWCMNMVLLPDENIESDERVKRIPGSKHTFELPTGEFEFVLAEEPELGCYYTCSLFSPMFEFQDQATAVATAEAALLSVMGEVHVDKKEVQARVAQARMDQSQPAISRRDFLRGAFRR